MKVEPLGPKGRQSVALATARLNLWEGSVRSGKTVASILTWVKFTRSGPAGDLLMVGKTERTLVRNIINPLIQMLGDKRCRYVAGVGELWILGRRIYVVGANNEGAVTKIQGMTLAGAYVDEAVTMPELMWSMLLTRLSVEGAQLFATMNPDNPNHWMMRDYLRRARVHLRHDGVTVHNDDADALDLHRFSFNLADNQTLNAAYLAALESEFTGLWRLRYIKGLWVLAEGAIYDTFDDTPVPWETEGAHVVSTLPDMRRWALAVDYGTVNPFVAALFGVGVDNRLYVVREYRHDSRKRRAQKTDAEYSTAMRQAVDGWRLELGRQGHVVDVDRVFVDPSAASFITQLYRDNWRGVNLADNAVADGIRAVASLRSADLLRVHESLADTGGIAELTSYVWDEKAAAKGVEQPLKVDDHYPDAERYGVAGLRSEWRYWVTDTLDGLADAA